MDRRNLHALPQDLARRVWRRIASAWFSAGTLRPIRRRLRSAGLPPLAPGILQRDDRDFHGDFLFLSKCAQRHGSIFNTNIGGQIVTCIADHGRARALFVDHEERLMPLDVPYGELVPGGFLRQLTGEYHHRMRRIFAHALRRSQVELHEPEVHKITQRALTALAAQGGNVGPDALIAALDRIATGSLLAICYGLREGDPTFDAFRAAYARLGPEHFVWAPGDAQRTAKADLAAGVTALLAQGAPEPPGVLHAIAAKEGRAAIDDAVIGNLVLMVEIGRYDLRNLLRWIVNFLGERPALLAAIRSGAETAPGRPSLAAATVLETLRLVQVEGVGRKAMADIVFDGITIPREAQVRGCIREAHRRADGFSDPGRFDPLRFVTADHGPDAYSPFGYDHHMCLGGDLSLRVATIMVETVARDFELDVLADGPYHRGPYHWEPAREFAVALTARH